MLGRISSRLMRIRGMLRLDKLNVESAYLSLTKSLILTYGKDEAMKIAVGGEFDAIGLLEVETLKHFGLQPDAYVIDVGCGSGRLAKPLSQYLTGRYLGIDIVPELVEYAEKLVGRPDWKFRVTKGLNIPEGDGMADWVCFFSVFTHLLHEHTYTYLQEARRVLKDGGKIIFSFLDFTIPEHWNVFESNLKDIHLSAHPLNMFISKDAIRVWAEHLGLQIQTIEDGNKPYVLLGSPVIFENGVIIKDKGSIGQSVCVMYK